MTSLSKLLPGKDLVSLMDVRGKTGNIDLFRLRVLDDPGHGWIVQIEVDGPDEVALLTIPIEKSELPTNAGVLMMMQTIFDNLTVRHALEGYAWSDVAMGIA